MDFPGRGGIAFVFLSVYNVVLSCYCILSGTEMKIISTVNQIYPVRWREDALVVLKVGHGYR